MSTIYLLRIVHIVSAVFWGGAVIFVAGFMLPSVRAAGPAGAPIMRQLVQVRRLPLWLMTAMIRTLLSGISLYWRDSDGFRSAWLASGPGRAFGLGGLLGILAAGLGMAVNTPTARRLGVLTARLQAEARPPTPDEAATLSRLQATLARATVAVAVLLTMAIVARAVARYVP